MTQRLLRVTMARALFVAGLVDTGFSMLGLWKLYPQFANIGRVYAHDSASLRVFLKSVEDQIATECIPHRQDCARGIVLQGVLVLALKGGAPTG